jgi:hypothetical protein
MTTATIVPAVTGCETDINGNVIYSVPSRTSSDTYLLVEANGELRCCCKGFTYRGRCAHLDAVAAYKRQTAKAANKDRDTAPLYRDNRPFSIFKAS